ncbi:MAG: TetR/AcrR family transcriptional regulator [Pseudobacteriovorax sp.]|nr:TetR/AcrR family transcriptional regulator [Pseudobacteriovorax sp.]
MRSKSRAYSEKDKQIKTDMIIEAAIKLYSQQRQLHTVNAIAREAAIGKGTIYSYFSSKEEIYMEALVRSFSQWHLGVRNFILDVSPLEQELIEFLCRSLANFTVFVDLVSISSVILEENLDPEYLDSVIKARKRESIRTSQLIASTYDKWSVDETIQNMRRFYTYGVGFWRECFPSGRVIALDPLLYGNKEEQTEKFFREILVVSKLFWRIE